MIPILYGHDHNSLPAGYLNTEGKIKLRKEAGITVQQLVNMEIGYIPTKLDGDVVIEAELIEISVRVKQ